MARVSIIIPTYNRAALLPRAVESAFGAGTDIEVVVIDNASSDHTPKLCEQLPGIKYLRFNTNIGPAGARNAGIMASGSEYIAFLDDDDLRLPGSIDKQIAILAATPQAAFVYGQIIITEFPDYNSTGKIVPQGSLQGDVFWTLLIRNFLATSAIVVRRSALDRVGLFNSNFAGAEDWDMWIRLAEESNVAVIREPVTVYRCASRGSGQLTSNLAATMRIAARVQQQGLRLPRALAAAPKQRKSVRKNFLDWAIEVLVSEAAVALAERAIAVVCQNLSAAFCLDPLRSLHPRMLYALLRSFAPRATAAPEMP